jgi:nucleoside-diphosphate-sugar epimerase
MKVCVTGGHGFLGSAVCDALKAKSIDVVSLGRKDGDLLHPMVAEKLLSGCDTVVHLAADVGGVGYLRSCAGRAFHANFQLGLNIVRTSCRLGVKRLVMAGTPCAYSGDATLPLQEGALVQGVPSGDTGSYGYAKLASSLVSEHFCKDFGVDTATVIPSNLYGPRDNFDSDKGHVVAALLKKALLAFESNQNSFSVWGDGAATRDFVYVHDVANAIANVVVSKEAHAGTTYNLGSGIETSIREIAHEVAAAVHERMSPKFDSDKPVGYNRRVMSIDRARELLQYEPSTSLKQGLRSTVQWLRNSGTVDKWLQTERRMAA